MAVDGDIEKNERLSVVETDALVRLLDTAIQTLEPIDYYDYVRAHREDQEILEQLTEREYVERDYELSTINLTYRGLLAIENPVSKAICCDCDKIFMYLREQRRKHSNDIRIQLREVLTKAYLSYFRTVKCLQFMKGIEGIRVYKQANEDPLIEVTEEIFKYETFSQYAIHNTPISLMPSVIMEPMTWMSDTSYAVRQLQQRLQGKRLPDTLEELNRAKYKVYRAALFLINQNPQKYIDVKHNQLDKNAVACDIYLQYATFWPGNDRCPLDEETIKECILNI